MVLAKLEYCDRSMAVLKDRDPVVTAEELDEDVSELPYSVEQFYRRHAPDAFEFPPGLTARCERSSRISGRPPRQTTARRCDGLRF